jgi:hypothetical protein
MSLGVSTLNQTDQLLFYDITANMDSVQGECLDKLLGLKAREVSTSGGNVARELAAWIQQHVLSNQERYCDLLQQELAKKRKP